MTANTYINKICKGFYTRQACGKCTVSMCVINLDYMSLTQVIDLLIGVTRKVSSCEFPTISNFSDCVTSCNPGDIRCVDGSRSSLDFKCYIDLVVKTITFWRLIIPGDELDAQHNKYEHDTHVRDLYTSRLRDVNSMDCLIECLRSMNECAI